MRGRHDTVWFSRLLARRHCLGLLSRVPPPLLSQVLGGWYRGGLSPEPTPVYK